MKTFNVIIKSEDNEFEVNITANSEEDALKRTLIYISNQEKNEYSKLFS